MCVTITRRSLQLLFLRLQTTSIFDRVMSFLQLFYRLRDHLFPPHCAGCSTPGSELCGECKRTLQVHYTMCRSCHRPNRDWATCLNCASHNPLSGVVIWFRYCWPLKRLILGLKFQHQYTISAFLAQKLALLIQAHPTLAQAAIHHHLLITSVPSHRRRKRIIKGYNQSELLAKTVALELNVPYVALTTKTKRTRSQVRLSRTARLTNLEGVFAVATTSLLTGKTILIVDDILTTGSTLKEVARTIKHVYKDVIIRWCVLARHGK